jgi:hypothetical protein
MGQGSLDTSVCTGQSEWDGQDVNSGDYGKPGTEVLDHDSWERTDQEDNEDGKRCVQNLMRRAATDSFLLLVG